VPLFVRLIVCELLFPMTTLPKLAVDGFAVSWPCTPVPLNAIVAGEPGALLLIEMLPVTLPADVGANFTGTVTLAPALIVCAPNPVKLNPVPEGVALVMLRAPLPDFVRVTFCEALLPTATLPNGTLVGLIVSCGCVCVPLPLRAIVSGDPGALLVIEILPVAAPVVVGANLAVNVVLCPALSVVAASPLMLYPVPVADPPEIATLVVPPFVSVMDAVALLPTSKGPKFTLDGLALRLACVPVPLNAIVIVGFVALLVIVIVPEALPAAAGANCAVNDVLWPAFSVMGPSALILKPVPDALAWEIATPVVPVFVSVIDCVLLIPTATLPNGILPGLALNVEFALVPVPARSSVCGESGELSVNLMLPVIPCAEEGVNWTLNEMLFPAAIVDGNDRPLIPNPVPEICARSTVRSTFPLFVS
jgi:hypothetical protein